MHAHTQSIVEMPWFWFFVDKAFETATATSAFSFHYREYVESNREAHASSSTIHWERRIRYHQVRHCFPRSRRPRGDTDGEKAKRWLFDSFSLSYCFTHSRQYHDAHNLTNERSFHLPRVRICAQCLAATKIETAILITARGFTDIKQTICQKGARRHAEWRM